MAGFDRIKPPEERLRQRKVTRDIDSSAADPEGRAALFSASDSATPGQAEPKDDTSPRSHTRAPVDEPAEQPPSTPADESRSSATDSQQSGPTNKSLLNVECQHCGVTAPMPIGTAMRKALPMAVINPLRSHPIFATCPCGERRAWLKPTLRLPR